MNMRLTWRKRQSESFANSTALVVIELPADELLVEEPASDELQEEPRRVTGLLARSRRLARRLNPAAPARIALGKSGRAAKSVVVKLRLRRLATAIREFRRIGSADLARLAHGVGRGAKGVGGRIGRISPRDARSVRAVTSMLRSLVRNISPSVATHVAREMTQLARTTIAKLDPRRVEDAVRRFVETIDVDGKGKTDKPSGGKRSDRMARAAVNKIGPERAETIAAEATRALRRLVDRLDPEQVGDVIRELVEAARSANDKKDRIRVVGFLASLVGEVGRALKSVAKDVEFRDVVVVVLVVLTTAPELLIAAGVSVAAIRVLTTLFTIFVQALPDRRSPLSANTRETREDRAARERADRRRPNFNFKEMGIEPGTELRFRDDETVTVEVVDEKRVRMGDEELSMTEATRRAREIDYAVPPMPHWRTPDGQLLGDIYNATYSPTGTGQ
ncbi:MAG: hypothetical protein OXE96_10725 [Gemmatimonadetes bacterium]|nr:hypothetical protein [Gemmatimonadota bacterium]